MLNKILKNKVNILFLFTFFTLLIGGCMNSLLFITPHKSLQNNKKLVMDTSNWITHPVGHYLIKLPPTTKIYGEFGGARISFTDDETNLMLPHPRSSLAKNITNANNYLKEEYQTLLKEEQEARLQNQEHSKVEYEYIENFGTDGLGSLLISHFADHSLYEMYIVNNKPSNAPHIQQIPYSYDHKIYSADALAKKYKTEKLNAQEYENYKNSHLDFINHVAHNIWYHDKTMPIRIDSGVYFDGGFLPIPENPSLYFGRVFLYVRFPEYPRIEFEIDMQHLNLKANETFAKNLFRPNEQNTLKFIDNGSKQEKLFTLHDGIKTYLFESVSPQGHTLEKPFVNVTMQNGDPFMHDYDEDLNNIYLPPLTEPSFSSDEEAIAFWNAIQESIRWRPDGVHVPLPEEAQGKPYFIVNDKIAPAE